MFCPKCGGQLSDDAAFCGKCGAALHTAAPAIDSGRPQCELVITRPKQFFVVNPVITVVIDQAQTYSIANDSTITIPLTAGAHSITFSCALRNKVLDIQIKDRAKLTVKFNRITGGMDVN